MTIFPCGFGFMQPYCEPYEKFVSQPSEADFVLAMNNVGHEGLHVIRQARDIAQAAGIPFCWLTIEDPNAYLATLPQAAMADYVFTSDKALLPQYREALGHERIYWLPLAACEALHKPLPLAEDAADFVFSGNWYENQWEARRWGTETVILPLARAGHSMAIFSYDEPPYPELRKFWRGGTSCYTVAEQYTHGKIVLGNNNQRSGMDGRAKTVMTSMRTPEVLACGKPFIAPQSDAYEALGYENDRHFYWVETPFEACEAAEAFLYGVLNGVREADRVSQAGRAFVLANHTYGHRLRRIVAAIRGEADPEDWR